MERIFLITAFQEAGSELPLLSLLFQAKQLKEKYMPIEFSPYVLIILIKTISVFMYCRQ